MYLDADTLVLKPIDDLFETNADFAAAPDIGWPDIFNSGVFCFKPSLDTYDELMRMASAGQSFDGGDQGLLNLYFDGKTRPFNRLSYTYNVTPSTSYQYLPAYRHFQSDIRVAHFIGPVKPWMHSRSGGSGGPAHELLDKWWAFWDAIRPAAENLAPEQPSEVVVEDIPRPTPESSTSEQTVPWNPAVSGPPSASLGEAHNLRLTSFANRWDSTQSSADDEPWIAPPASAIPPGLDYLERIPTQPNPSRVFPWDRNQDKTRSGMLPTRIFPEDLLRQHEEPALPPRRREREGSLEEVAFTNAWDSLPLIQHYVSTTLMAEHRQQQRDVPQTADLPSERSGPPTVDNHHSSSSNDKKTSPKSTRFLDHSEIIGEASEGRWKH